MTSDPFLVVLTFVFGAAVGSFVNVIALRYQSGLSFTKGSSICLSCTKTLRWYELIPIISYLYLRGRCSSCYSRFSIQYFLVELISGLALVYLSLEFGIWNLEFFLLSIIYYLLSIIFIYDLRHKIIPDSFVILFIALSFSYSYFILHTSYLNLLAAIIIPLPFFLIWLLSSGRLMGLGDAKLMAGMGALLGLGSGVSATFLAFWLGAIFILILYTYNKFSKAGYNIGMKSEIPFGPFLIIATALTFFLDFNFFNLG